MFKQLKLTTKILVFIGGGVVSFLVVIITFSTLMLSNRVLIEAYKQSQEIAYRHSNAVKAEIEVSLDTARSLAQTFEGMKSAQTPDRMVMDSILKNILAKDIRYLGNR